jgi:hypothetical protein
MYRPSLRRRFAWAGLIVAALLTVGSTISVPARAGAISPIVPPPIFVHCWLIPHDAQIALNTAYYTVVVSGTCFLGSTDYVAVYDVTQGRYLTGGGAWQTVTTDGNGNFSLTVPGANCYDRVEAIAYDTGWNSYTNQGNWQVGTLQCPPK